MISEATFRAVQEFSEVRDWDRFHAPVNLAMSIAIEAGELLECFQWGDCPDGHRVQEELADVVTYCILMATKLGIDLDSAVMEKMADSAAKYPVEKARGRSVKYDKL